MSRSLSAGLPASFSARAFRRCSLLDSVSRSKPFPGILATPAGTFTKMLIRCLESGTFACAMEKIGGAAEGSAENWQKPSVLTDPFCCGLSPQRLDRCAVNHSHLLEFQKLHSLALPVYRRVNTERQTSLPTHAYQVFQMNLYRAQACCKTVAGRGSQRCDVSRRFFSC